MRQTADRFENPADYLRVFEIDVFRGEKAFPWGCGINVFIAIAQKKAEGSLHGLYRSNRRDANYAERAT